MLPLILDDDSFFMYAAKMYDNPGCISKKEFLADLDRIKYLKRLFRRYQRKNDIDALRVRLALNHIIVIYNVFKSEAATKILFYKLGSDAWPLLKTFLIFLNRLPEKIQGVQKKDINTATIKMDPRIIEELRKIDANSRPHHYIQNN